MRLDDQEESSNVEDRRSGGSGIGGKGIGVGTIVLALVAMYFGVDPAVVLNVGQGLQQTETAESQSIRKMTHGCICSQGAWEHRRNLGQGISTVRSSISGAEVGIVHRPNKYGMWCRSSSDGAFLLSG